MRRFSIIVLIVLLAVAMFGASTVSAQPDNPQCWGIVSSQLASSSPGTLGDHASEEGVPRDGLGNLSRDLGFDHIGDFGSFLATIDGVDATACP